ncbi:hypothetical protein BBJ28_00004375, partial [Nothophytophthora sp. Chile5]
MEPLAATGGRVVPKLHLLNAVGAGEDSRCYTDRDGRVQSQAEFQVLHPAIDELADERGEDLARLLLNRWSIHTGEEQFASISLFCEMKLNEAKRMASWAEAPNRFYTVVCCQLLDKYIARLAATRSQTGDSTEGQSLAFLRRIHAEFVASIFLPPTQAQIKAHAASSGRLGYEHRTPYFAVRWLARFSLLLVHLVRQKAGDLTCFVMVLLATVQDRESTRMTRQQLPGKVDQLVTRLAARRGRQTLALQLKCRAFQSMRKTNLTAWFRVWRVEALRRAYQRESVDYQTMLSVTAASLSRKDIVIAEAEAKVTSMARIIDSLTESNKQLSCRVDQLENLAAAMTNGEGRGSSRGFGSDDSGRQFQGPGGGDSAAGHRPEARYERIDTLLSQDDERMDRVNRMLLETMFGMARMVETSAIQMAKETMDSLEYQLDGSVLQHLAELVQTENALKAKADAVEGAANLKLGALHAGKNNGGRMTALVAAASTPSISPNVAVSRSMRPGPVTIRDLTQMPIDVLLLYWFRMHLSLSSSVEKPADRTIKNFTSDLADGRRFSFLLHRLFPTWFDTSQRGDFLNIVTAWRRVRGLLLEVKRMNDNYDALMIVHLLKEMRTCETLFKQLHA